MKLRLILKKLFILKLKFKPKDWKSIILILYYINYLKKFKIIRFYFV